jgi:hypothetical protein
MDEVTLDDLAVRRLCAEGMGEKSILKERMTKENSPRANA